MKTTALSTRIEEICERFQVERLEIFGSRARDEAEATSDFDFLVKFKELSPPEYSRNYFGLLHALEDELKAPVDLLTQPAITKKSLQRSIEQEKRPIYAS